VAALDPVVDGLDRDLAKGGYLAGGQQGSHLHGYGLSRKKVEKTKNL
jgi:hypothetical protein